ncbi:MAG: hypothetical protein O2954_01525 [bacterium]|nr:hypothetical protein [bacterium]
MLRGIQILVFFLAVATFTGCYTQLQAPGSSGHTLAPPPERPGLSNRDLEPTRVDVYFHSSIFPGYGYAPDPWDLMFYDPYQNWWIQRTLLPYQYDRFPGGYNLFWNDPVYASNRVLVYGPNGRWYLLPLGYAGHRWHPRHLPVGSPPPPLQTISPRSRIQRSGFAGGETPSGSAVRQPEPTQPQMTAPPPPPPPPPPPQPKDEDEEESKEEKREKKREKTKPRGGMR